MDQLESPTKRRKDDHEHHNYEHATAIGPTSYAHGSHGPPPQYYYHTNHSGGGVPPSNYQTWQGNSTKGAPPTTHHGYLPGSPSIYHGHGPPVDHPYHSNGSHLSQQYHYRESSTIGSNLPANSGTHASHNAYDYPSTKMMNNSMPLTSVAPRNLQIAPSNFDGKSGVTSTESHDSKVQNPATDENTRGSYRCGRCGVPKKGHVCPYQPKLKRRADEPVPEMKNAACQVEMDEFLVLRRLNLEIQGLPETYTSEPIGNVGYDVAPDSTDLQPIDIPNTNIKKDGDLSVPASRDIDATSGSTSVTVTGTPSVGVDTADNKEKS